MAKKTEGEILERLEKLETKYDSLRKDHDHLVNHYTKFLKAITVLHGPERKVKDK